MLNKIKDKMCEVLSIIKKVFLNLMFMFNFSWKIAKSRFFISTANIIVNSITPFIYLIIPKYILDELGSEKRWDVVLKYIAILVIMTGILKIFNWTFWYFQSRSEVKCRLRNDNIFLSLGIELDYEKLEDSQIKDLAVKVRTNIHILRFTDRIIPDFLTNLFQLIGYTYIITQLHPLIIVIILLIIYINSIISKKRESIGYNFQPIITNFSRRANYVYNSMISFDSGKEIRINRASEWLKNKYRSETKNYMNKFIEKQNKEFTLTIVDHIIGAIQTLILYGYSTYMVIMDKITIGSFSVYLGAITNFTSSFTGFISKFIGIRYWSYFIDDFKKYIGIAKTLNNNINDNIKAEDLKEGDFEFVNVSFKYPNTERYVLKNVSLTIKNGEKLSIVGYNGAGKSTFIKLICRLYTPTEGRILYNGIDISTINYELYRNLISVVFQDYQLFPFSIRENIVLAQDDREEKVMSAIVKSGLSDKIKSLKAGFSTSISKEFDDKGIEFSGGEGQKLASARAYYKESPIVILDEPTASLDPVSESELYERFNSIMEDRTAIYISHRMASSKFCDRIAVIVDGQIVEYGDHCSLLEKKGVYEKMFSTQSQYYKEEILENAVK